MTFIPDSWWVVAGLLAAAAVIVVVMFFESRRYWRTQPGAPAVRLPDGNWPRLGPPTDHCRFDRHWKCDGITKAGGPTCQCSCKCHRPAEDQAPHFDTR